MANAIGRPSRVAARIAAATAAERVAAAISRRMAKEPSAEGKVRV
jgi:hypothetical protein